jgi:phenylacetate-CoA ligase
MKTVPSVWPPTYDEAYRPPHDSPAWDAALEFMDRDVRAGLIVRKLRSQLEWAYTHSDFYRQKWDRAGVDLDKIQTLADLRRIPLLRKEEIRAEQTEFPPFGRYLCMPRDQVARVHGTSGTTGRPTAFGISAGDWRRIGNAHARIMWAAGIRPTDTVFLGSFFGLYLGGWGAIVGAERLGATCFPFGAGVPGQTAQAVEWLAQMRPTALYATPSYALRVAEVAQKVGYDPRVFGIRVLFFSGEPGAGIPSTKRQIEETYGGICIDMGSMAEMTPWMTNAECSERTGMHLWEDIVYTELLDPETEEPVGPGEVGVPVYTHLERESQPMIRMWSGDLSRFTDEPCPCGRTYARLPDGLFGRADDMLVIRGENVYPSAIEEALRGGGCHGEFRVIVSRQQAMDELVVRVEGEPLLDPEQLRTGLEERLRARLGIRAIVEIVPAGSLERTEFKSHRIVDQREIFEQLRAIRHNVPVTKG